MYRSAVTLMALGVLISSGRMAFALERCSRLVVTTTGILPPAWQKAADALRAELAGLDDADCVEATIVVSREDQQGRLEVTAADGRRARRTVATPDELAAVAYGVLASVPPESAKESDESAAAPPPVPIGPEPPPPASAEPPPVAEQPPLRSKTPDAGPASLGLTFGTRVALPTGVVSPELELRGDVHLERWVVSLSARAAPDGSRMKGTDDTTAEQSEVSFGALGGRWFSLGGGVLTATAGPRASFMTEWTDAAHRTRHDLWVQAATRYVFPLGERWKPALGLEVDAAPGRLAAAQTSTSMPFPSWSMAVRFGIVGGVR
jgi:hypothetical protein